jgi:glycosyltransferase EpsH
MYGDLVTIVIPAYNADQFLRENVESIINQTYKNLEIIYICDGCTDGTVALLQEYAEKDSRIVLQVELENQGAAKSRNIGMNKANGEWIIFWDADDVFNCRTIETLLITAVKEQADVVSCYWECFEEVPSGHAIIDNEMRKLCCDTYPVVNTSKELHQIMQLVDNSPCTKLVHKSIYRKEEVFFQDVPNANDVYYAMVVAMNSHKIAYVDEPLLYIRMNKNRSTISTIRDSKQSFILEALDQVYRYIVCMENRKLLLQSFYNNVFYNFSYYLELPVYDLLFDSLRNNYLEKWNMMEEKIEQGLTCVNKVLYQNVLANKRNIDRQNLLLHAKVELVRRLSVKGCSLWGMGIMGKKLLEELSKTGIKIQHVFDSAQAQWGKVLYGYVVENFNEVQADHIIITTPQFYDEISKQIENRVQNIYNPEQQIWLIPLGNEV